MYWNVTVIVVHVIMLLDNRTAPKKEAKSE